MIYREGSEIDPTTDLDHSFLVHDDAIAGVLGQLVQGHDGAAVDGFVFGAEVADQGGHGARVAEGGPVAAPHAAVADGLGQVAAQPVISLRTGRQDAVTPPEAALCVMQTTTDSAASSWQRLFSSAGFMLQTSCEILLSASGG